MLFRSLIIASSFFYSLSHTYSYSFHHILIFINTFLFFFSHHLILSPGGIIGYAAAAKRGVQDSDSDISPTAASSSTASHFNEKNHSVNSKRPPIRKSVSHESGTRTISMTSSLVPATMTSLGLQNSHKMSSTPQISPTTVTAISSPSIPTAGASSTSVSDVTPPTPVHVTSTAGESSGEKGFRKAGKKGHRTCT